MFKITRTTDESPSKSEETKEMVLTELDHQLHEENHEKAKTLAETYKILTEADKPAEKRGSDQVLVTCISAGASLLGILAVIGHEHLSPFASKAVGFIVKPRI